MEFRFINNNAPLDRRSQRLVRNHAMKGKNLGRIIPGRGHKRQQREDGIHGPHPTTEQDLKLYTECEKGRHILPKNILAPNPYSGAELGYFTMSVQLTPSVRYLFYEFHYSVSQSLYPQVFCRRAEVNETFWFERVMGDPCAFHCAMAITKARISHSKCGSGRSLESTRHLLMAIRLLRGDLDAASEPRASSIVVAISLAMYANENGSTSESRIHLLGLKRILELNPGGLTLLCSASPEVWNKIRRTDIELALMAGTPMIFGSQHLPLPRPLYVVPLDDRRRCVALPHSRHETSPEIQYAMNDVLTLCSFAGRAKLGAFEFQDLVISILQRLIEFAPLGGERPSNPLDDVFQLGLLTFMSTFLSHILDKRSNCPELLYISFRTSLERFNEEIACSTANAYSSLHLWLMFRYALSTPDYENSFDTDGSFARSVCALTTVLQLETWEDIIAHLSVYPWVAAFHNESSKKIWLDITS